MAYSKIDLLNDINALVEKYITQELAAHLSQDLGAEIPVEPDADGHYIDLATGNIWDLEKQEIIGHKDCKTGVKTWTVEPVKQAELAETVKQAEPVKEAELAEPVKEAELAEPVKEAELAETVKEAELAETVKEEPKAEQPKETQESEEVQKTEPVVKQPRKRSSKPPAPKKTKSIK